jgi:hypothetical protein
MTYNVVLSGFETKEQAEEFVSWYGNSGEQDFGNHLDHQDCGMSFASVDYYKTPSWFGDNLVTHLNIFKKDDDE